MELRLCSPRDPGAVPLEEEVLHLAGGDVGRVHRRLERRVVQRSLYPGVERHPAGERDVRRGSAPSAARGPSVWRPTVASTRLPRFSSHRGGSPGPGPRPGAASARWTARPREPEWLVRLELPARLGIGQGEGLHPEAASRSSSAVPPRVQLERQGPADAGVEVQRAPAGRGSVSSTGFSARSPRWSSCALTWALASSTRSTSAMWTDSLSARTRVSLTRSEGRLPSALTPGCRSGPVASRWSFPRAGERREPRRGKAAEGAAEEREESVASASSDAWMAFGAALAASLELETGEQRTQLAEVERSRSAVACSSTAADRRLRTRLGGPRGRRRRSASPGSSRRRVRPRVRARSLAGPSVRSCARLTCLSSTVAPLDPRRLHVPTCLERELGRSGAASEVGPGGGPVQPALARELHRNARGPAQGSAPAPTAGGTTRRSSRASIAVPFLLPAPSGPGPASPRSTAPSSARSSPVPRTESCSGPSTRPDTAPRPSSWPSNAPVGPAYRPPARSPRPVSATRRGLLCRNPGPAAPRRGPG